MKHFSVIIDPCSNILYASYYIYGLLRYFGQSAIHFSSAPFVGLRHDKDTFCLPFVIRQNGGGKCATVLIRVIPTSVFTRRSMIGVMYMGR